MYQRLWMARRRKAFFVGKKCDECGRKKDLLLCGVRTRNGDHSLFSYSVKEQKKILKANKDVRVLCYTCRYNLEAPESYRQKKAAWKRRKRAEDKEVLRQKLIALARKRGLTFLKHD